MVTEVILTNRSYQFKVKVNNTFVNTYIDIQLLLDSNLLHKSSKEHFDELIMYYYTDAVIKNRFLFYKIHLQSNCFITFIVNKSKLCYSINNIWQLIV